MKLFLNLIILALAAVTAHAQCANIRWINPFPQSRSLEDVTYVNDQKAFAIGERGALVRTLDGGDTWEMMPQIQEWDFHEIVFPTEQIGYACGTINTSGIIIKTIDGGDTWFTLITGGSTTLGNTTSLWAFDENTLLCGGFNKIFRTTDGGLNWSSVTVGNNYTVTDLYFTSAQEGHCIAGGRIYKTTNGGLNWTQKLYDSSNLLYAICFSNDTLGFAAVNGSFSGQLYKTVDGGETWTLTTNAMAGNVNQIYFANDSVGWAAAGSFNGVIYRTEDYGQSWTNVYSSVSYLDFLSITSRGVDDVICVGDLGALIVSHNSGQSGSWSTLPLNLSYGPKALDMVSPDVGYFTGNGWVRKTTDHAQTFVHTVLPTTNQPTCMHFPHADTGYIAGIDGMRYRTYNSGQTWTNQSVSTTSDTWDIQFISGKKGFMCGSGGYVGKTTDGGNTFSNISIGQNLTMRGVYFLNPDTGFVCGEAGTLKRTYDGGATWTSIATGTTSIWFLSLYFVNDTLGFCGGGSGRLLRTTNGGATWTVGSAGYGDDIVDIYFTDANNGCFLTSGFNGTIYRTWNAGLNWQYLTILNNGYTNDLDMADDTSIFVCGDYAALWEVTAKIPDPQLPEEVTVCRGQLIDSQVPDDLTVRWATKPWAGTLLSTSNFFDTNLLTTSDTIWLAYFDSLDCNSVYKPIRVTLLDAIESPTIVSDAIGLCPGATATLSSADNSEVLWSSGEISSNITVSTPGDYYAVRDNGVCQSPPSNTISISNSTVPNAPSADVTIASPCLREGITIAFDNADVPVYINSLADPLSATTIDPGASLVYESLASDTTLYAYYQSTDGCYSEGAIIDIHFPLLPPAPVISHDLSTICNGQSVTLSIAPDFTIVWNDGESEAVRTITTAGTYSAQYLSAEGCSSAFSADVTITVSDLDTPQITATASTFCEGETIELTEANGYSVVWSNQTEGTYTTINASGVYYAHLTIGECSTTSAPFTATMIPLPAAAVPIASAYDPCEAGAVNLSLLNGGNAEWYDNAGNLLATSATFTTPLLFESTNFLAREVNELGCTGEEGSIVLTIHPRPAAPIIEATATTICASQSTFLSTVNGESTLWSNGTSAAAIEIYESGEYWAIAENQGCFSISDTIMISVVAGPTETIIVSTPYETCVPGTVTLTLASGDQAYWYDISGNLLTTGNSFTSPILSHVTYYYAESFNEAGCTGPMSGLGINIHEPPATPIITTMNTDLCEGETTWLVVENADGTVWSTGEVADSIQVVFGDVYTAVNTSGICESAVSNAITVVVHELPAIPTIVQVNDDSLMVQGNYSNYQWYFEGSPLAGNDAVLNTGQTTGTYSVTVFNEYGCANYSNGFYYEYIGIEEHENAVSIYPNPTSEMLTVQAGWVVDHWTLRDSQGRVVLQENANKTMFRIDLNVASNGVYYLELLSTDGKMNTRKVVVSH